MRVSLSDRVDVTCDLVGPTLSGRYFFNLTDGQDILTDDTGFEVHSFSDAKVQALNAIDELRQEEEFAAFEWEGWRIEVTDRFGSIAFTVPLSDPMIEPYRDHRPATGGCSPN